MSEISTELTKLLLSWGDETGDLSPFADQRRHDVTFRHIHPRSQNGRGDYPLQSDIMSAGRLA